MTPRTPQVGDGHHGCYPQRLIVKFDGGDLPMLCPTCRRIVGYMPSGWACVENLSRPEREVKAEALREAADWLDATYRQAQVLEPDIPSLEADMLRGRADYLERGGA